MGETNRHWSLAVGTAIGLVAHSGALAQEVPATGATRPSDAAPAEPSSGIADIIVTAQKRAQSIQDVPIAVSAFSDETLRQAGVTNVFQLADVSPTLTFQRAEGDVAGSSLRLRGLGTTAQSAGFDPGVGIFLDNVIITRAGVAAFDLIDIERVELLRGPQGTLFGRNTSFGAVSIITKQPSFTFGGEAEATYGNYDTVVLRGSMTGPIAGDTLAARITGGFQRRDGYINVIGGKDVNSRNRWSLRGQLLWQPTTDLSVRLIGDYTRVREACCYPVFRNATAAPVAAFGAALGGAIPPNPFEDYTLQLSQGVKNSTHVDNYGVSAEVNWDLGAATLTSISAFRRLTSETANDSDFGALDIFTRDPLGFNVRTISQEVRLAGRSSLGSIKFDWIVGGFYIDDQVDSRNRYMTGSGFQRYANNRLAVFTGGARTVESLAGVAPGTTVIGAGFGSDDRFFQDTKGLGLFTHNVFSLTDRLDFTIGVRYSKDKKRGGGDLTNDPQFVSYCNLLRPIGILPLNLLACPFFVAQTPPAPGSLNYANFRGRRSDDDFSGTIRLSYQLGGLLPDFIDKFLLFGGFSRGFKGGGFNLDRANLVYPTLAAQQSGTPVNDPGFKPESVDNYEIGFKSTLFDRRLIANVTGYKMKIKDLQQLTFTGAAFLVGNIDKARNKGVEVELTALPTERLSLNAAYLYTDARYPRNQTFLPIFAGLGGQQIVSAPKNTYTFGATYVLPVPSAGLKLSLHGDGRIESAQLTATALNSRISGRESYNARFTIAQEDDRWALELWSRNLTDERTPRLIIPHFFPTSAFLGYTDDPRTYGVTGRFRF